MEEKSSGRGAADREHRAATWFAAMYRGKIARRIVAQWRNQQASARKTYRAAMIMQRTVHAPPREAARRIVPAGRRGDAPGCGRLRARQDRRAVMLQAALRGMFARQEALRLKAIRDAKRAEEKARAQAALRIQAQYRASLGRDEAAGRRTLEHTEGGSGARLGRSRAGCGAAGAACARPRSEKPRPTRSRTRWPRRFRRRGARRNRGTWPRSSCSGSLAGRGEGRRRAHPVVGAGVLR